MGAPSARLQRSSFTDIAVRYDDTVISILSQRRAATDEAIDGLQRNSRTVACAAALLVDTLQSGHKVLVAGNGGSAAEAQHFAAELVGRFKRERQPYAALALTVDSSVLTALANDYGYEQVFARQVLALGQAGDLFVAYSTSGESENLLQAADAAHLRGMTVLAIAGDRPSRLEQCADVTLRAPISGTAEAQEIHLLLTHVLCDIAESELAGAKR